MGQNATLYLLPKTDLESLQNFYTSSNAGKKNWLIPGKKKLHSFSKKLDSMAIEKTDFRWSGIAFVILSVFSKEQLQVDWHTLEYGNISIDLSEKWETGIFIFSSTDDEGLQKLKPNGFYYSFEEVDEFAIELEGSMPANAEIMKKAIELLDSYLLQLTEEKIIMLVIE